MRYYLMPAEYINNVNEMTEQEKNNAISIGVDGMLWQTQEECGELVKAIGKYNRSRGLGQKTETPRQEAFNNLVEEIADVEICIRHIKYLLNIDTDNIQHNKIDKVQKRYKKEHF